jgi:predicted MPP superfamily phosphohydrolase
MQLSDYSGFDPLLEILEGLSQDIPVYYVGGNWGPYDLDPITGEVLAAGKILQSHGVSLLTQPSQINKGEDFIWFVPGFSYSENQKWIDIAEEKLNTNLEPLTQLYYSQTLNYQSALLNSINEIPDSDVMIGMVHIPLSQDALDSMTDYPPYDLVIAGHFHGGQIRLPLVGALYVPDNQSKLGGFFPDNRYISGLYAGKAAHQYISRGLGATSIIPLLKFRLFNPPEINLITLQSSDQ